MEMVGGASLVPVGASKGPRHSSHRFADPVWQDGWCRRMALSYLATRDAVLRTTGEFGLDEKSAERARFALMQVAEALAPTNSPARRKSGSQLHPAVLPAPGQYVHER